jgi:hypothetical protein
MKNFLEHFSAKSFLEKIWQKMYLVAGSRTVPGSFEKSERK